jgi:hypothetical protein
MIWVLVGAAWLVLALLVAVLIGRSVRIADRRAAADAAAEANFVVDSAASHAAPHAASAGAPPVTTAETSGPDLPAPTYDTPTIPGIPVARPSAAQGKIIRRRQTPPPARRSESA